MRPITYFIFFISGLLYAQDSFTRGESLYEQERYHEARKAFLDHLTQDPDHQKSREYLGDIACLDKDWDKALEYYEPLVEATPGSANYHFKYGGTLGMKALEVNKMRALGYISSIKHHLKRAAELDPRHVEVRWALVEFYIQLPGIIGGSEKTAMKYADQLLEFSPVDGHLCHGYIAEYSDRPKDAEYHYKKAISVGGSELTYDKLINFYENNDRPEAAIEKAGESKRIHKRNRLNYQIGKIAAQYNVNSELGIECLKSYIANHSAKDGVPVDWAYFRLAQIYKNLGDKGQALQWIDKALADRPDFEEAMREKQIILSL